MMKLFAQSLLVVALAQAATEETCTQEATLSDSSAHDVGMYSYNPITMVSQDQTTVTVTIDQSWTDGPLGGLKVLYGSGGEMECATSLGLEGSTAEYTADCVDGVALFGLFAGDDSFSGVTDISGDFPDECMVDGEAGPTYDKYASFMFRVPCDASDESFCPGKLCTDNEPPEGYAFCYQMYNAGTQNSESKNYIESSKAYCKNDCENDLYCFYVVAESGYYLADEEAWFKDYSTGNSVIPADGGINFIKDDNGNTIAWEGCFDLPEGADGASIEIHANFGPFGQTAGSTTSTGKRTGKDTSTVSIDYGTCDSPVLPPFSSANSNQGDDGEEGGGFGDPHLKTWTGEVYDFHGACDLVLVRSKSFHNDAGLEVHIRTVMRDDWSFISSAAIRIGEDTFEVGQHANYWLNGVGGVDLPDTVGGFPVTALHHGDRRTLYQIDLGHMGLFEVRVFGEFLAVEIHKAHSDGFLDSQGLMGDFMDGSLLGRSGEVIADHNEFGLDWQVHDTDPHLFQRAEGPQYPQLCHMPEAKALKERRMSESMVSFEDAEKACADWDEATKESCIYDVMATGDLSMAQAGAF